jgi:hypothetical protein
MTLSAADDSFHPVADPDPLWTETTWWGFQVPERAVGGMIYTLFRPNLGVASLVVAVWDGEAVEPWRAPYARSRWHIPYPAGDLADCHIGPLHLRCLEPLHRYRLVHEDLFDLEYTGMAPPDEAPGRGGSGHFDQLCRVTGTLDVEGSVVAVDAPAVRDRSWYVRPDDRSLRASYTYAVVDADDHVVVHGIGDPSAVDGSIVFGGYLQRDGRRTRLQGGTRQVVSRRRGHPERIVIEVADVEGRSAALEGMVSASLASQSTPGMFAWMSVVRWTLDGRGATGEDHDVWSPDMLPAR